MLDRSDLHAYQTDQAIPHILEHERCAVWMPVGAGKSVTTLTALDDLSLVERDVWPALVLGTKRIAQSVWPAEVNDWSHLAHLTVSAIVGTDDQRRAALLRKVHIYTINYENVGWLADLLGDDWPFKTVIADELPKLKSFRLRQGGKNAGALGKVAHKHVRRFIGLTANPAANGLKDLWGQTWFIDKGARLGGTFSAFEDRWFRKGYDGYSLEPMPHAEREIHEKLYDICRTIEVPPAEAPVVNNIYVDLPASVRSLYAQMEKEMYAEIEAGIGVEAFNAASRTSKCEQIANGAVYYDDEKNWKKLHDAKIEVIEEIVTESSGAPVLTQYQFRHELECLKRAFPKARVLDDNPKTIDQWNAGEIGHMLGHAAAAGHGLNLARGGNILARGGFSWSLDEFDQILGRIGPRRQKQAGLNRAVFDHRILVRDTIDEQKLERVNTKRTVEQILLDAMRRRK